MREKDLFEYAIIRVVPRVEREEFLNVGVVLYCAGQNFLACKYHLDREKLFSFRKEIDIDVIEQGLKSFDNICKGNIEGGPIAKLNIASRFRWLTAMRSTIIQTSRVHPGFCRKGEDSLEKLLKDYVL